jgi:hypothetical protein
MPGLDPGIHQSKKDSSMRSRWIAGSSPAMTGNGYFSPLSRLSFAQ